MLFRSAYEERMEMHVVLGGQSQIKSMDLTLNGIRESFLLSQIGLHLVVFIALTGSSSSRGYLMIDLQNSGRICFTVQNPLRRRKDSVYIYRKWLQRFLIIYNHLILEGFENPVHSNAEDQQNRTEKYKYPKYHLAAQRTWRSVFLFPFH